VDGVVLRVPAPSEGPVMAGAPLLEVGALSFLEVLVEAQTPDAVLLRPGMKVEMADWGGGKTLHGRVQRIEPSAFKAVSPLGVEEQRVNVVIDFSSNPESRPGLGDGYELTVRFILWESERVLKVPSAAVFRESRDWAVWRVEGKRARLRKVVLGRRGIDEVQVESGLAEGDVVILHPPETVEEGVSVTLR
jgi:HlyD family secretion protein